MLNFKSKFAICLMECTLRKVQYAGKAETPFNSTERKMQTIQNLSLPISISENLGTTLTYNQFLH